MAYLHGFPQTKSIYPTTYCNPQPSKQAKTFFKPIKVYSGSLFFEIQLKEAKQKPSWLKSGF